MRENIYNNFPSRVRENQKQWEQWEQMAESIDNTRFLVGTNLGTSWEQWEQVKRGDLLELPFERPAMKGEEMPNGLCLSEQRTFLALRMLYSEYRRGNIEREQASREKIKIIQQMEHELKVDQQNAKIAQLWKQIEQPAREYVFDSTIANADKFYAAVYSLPGNWRATTPASETGRIAGE